MVVIRLGFICLVLIVLAVFLACLGVIIAGFYRKLKEYRVKRQNRRIDTWA